MFKKFFLTAVALAVVFTASSAVADWVPEDGHKMHYPQLPDEAGWDVNATGNGDFPIVLADDWMCSESGWVKDIHFWGSWMHGMTGEIISFNLSIHEDIPADPPMIPYSRPGLTLWEQDIPIEMVTMLMFSSPTPEGWYDPHDGQYFMDDHMEYFQYNVFLPEALWFWQEQGTIYWLNISAIVFDPEMTKWGWKSSLDHWNDDAVWAYWGELSWVDMWEPPDFMVSLDLSFVITGGEDEVGACCYPDLSGNNSLCIVTTQFDCVNNLLGVYEGDGTLCQGMEACCLSDGSCVDADALCCVNELGGTPQGPGTACNGIEACCFTDGSCQNLDPICCVALGGAPQGPGTVCTVTEACCMQDGSCRDLDPLCCSNLGGTPQGPGTVCTATEACCFPDGSCQNLDPLCCDDQGGLPSPIGATACMGDLNGNFIDDACEVNDFDLKWEQLPDLAPTGIDIHATDPLILADDFLCISTGSIREIHIWGSWLYDEIPGDPNNIGFLLSFHRDIPADPPEIPYSMPGEILWMGEFMPGSFYCQLYEGGLEEGWYDPSEGFFLPFGDTQCWEYVFYLDSGMFIQHGTEQDPIVYWLDVKAIPIDPGYFFGWKTSIDHWNDDATWGLGVDPPDFWYELRYPDGHPYHPESIDLAFAIYGVEEEEVGACCYPDPTSGYNSLCVVTTMNDCVNNLLGVYEGDGTLCQGIEACCLSDGSCVDADALCCVNELGGTPQGPGTVCTATEACCMSDGSCRDLDPLCCALLGGAPQGPGTACNGIEACCMLDGSCQDLDPICCAALGGAPQGPGTVCTVTEACCMSDGSCQDLDPLCCSNLGGTPQGGGTACTAATEACCFPDGSCRDLDPLCCDDQGGSPSPIGATACMGDLNGNFIDDACEEGFDLKWEQLPDLAPTGMDVHVMDPLILADDFLCTSQGSVREIHIWGSWLYDDIPADPGNIGFILSFHRDIPANPPDLPYSMPGEILWMGDFMPGSFTCQLYEGGLEEGWYDPSEGFFLPFGDTQCWEYVFYLDSGMFIQEGTVDYPVIYWLDVKAISIEPACFFGWKTSVDHWNDDATWGLGDDPPDFWYELRYPDGHPYAPESIDLAFAIYGVEEPCDCTPGEVNLSPPINLLDILYLIQYKYKGGPPPQPYDTCSGDANCNCLVDLLDILYLIQYKYKSGPAPCSCQDWLNACGPPLRKE